LEMTLLFIITASTPTEVRMQEFMKGLPTFAIYIVISIVQMFATPERIVILTWKKYVPYAITNIAPDAACVDTAATANSVRRLSTGSLQISKKFAFSFIAFSASIAVCISANSPGTLSACGRIHSIDFSACACLSISISHLGLSGMKNRPMDRKTGTMKIVPRGMI
jgi:hypothetical protein